MELGIKIIALFISILTFLGVYNPPVSEIPKKEIVGLVKQVGSTNPQTRQIKNISSIKNQSPVIKNSKVKTQNKILTEPLSLPVLIPVPPPVNWDMVNEKTRTAIVNIYCTGKRGNFTSPVSGSGVVIDPRGVILTNAHVAQYLLLADYPIPELLECVIRTGSPASRRYTVKPLYISPRWIENNYKNLIIENPQGTGEDDFAFLLVNGSTNETNPVPESISFLTTDTSDIGARLGHSVLIAGYPAGFLDGTIIEKNLYSVSSFVKIGQLLTFGDGQRDSVSLGGSVTAQKGSSGGAVVSAESRLIALISTEQEAPNTSERELYAITLSHIDRSLVLQTGMTLAEFLASDINALSEKFNQETAPRLAKLLTDKATSTPTGE